MNRAYRKASTYPITKKSIVTAACTLALTLFALPIDSHALFIDTGINSGYVQLGANGSNGTTGTGGAGGAGGIGGRRRQ